MTLSAAKKQYLAEHQANIEKFGHCLGIKGQTAPDFLINPGVGADLHNILMLTDAPNIVLTDCVDLDEKELATISESDVYPMLKGDPYVVMRGKIMHTVLYDRITMLGYTIQSITKDKNNLIYISIQKDGVMRNIYYMTVDHKSREKNTQFLEAVNSLIPRTAKVVYLQKALEPDVAFTNGYQALLRSFKIYHPQVNFIMDGTTQYEYYHYKSNEAVRFQIDSDEVFCYGNRMWQVDRPLSSDELKRVAMKKFEIGYLPFQERLDAIDINSPPFQLYLAFKQSEATSLLDLIKNPNHPDFLLPEEVASYFQRVSNILIGFTSFVELANTPLSKAILIYSPCTLLIKYEHRQTKSAHTLWSRIGLGDEFLKQFKNEDDFWKSKKTLLEIYHELKGLQAKPSASYNT